VLLSIFNILLIGECSDLGPGDSKTHFLSDIIPRFSCTSICFAQLEPLLKEVNRGLILEVILTLPSRPADNHPLY